MKPAKKPAAPPLTRRRILSTLRERQDLLDRYSVRRIALFGSYARGKATGKSDIDFLVEFGEPSLANFMGLIWALEKLFGRRVDVLTPDALKTIRVPRVGESIRKSLAYV
jgi:predicted nucleotidyltransferase